MQIKRGKNSDALEAQHLFPMFSISARVCFITLSTMQAIAVKAVLEFSCLLSARTDLFQSNSTYQDQMRSRGLLDIKIFSMLIAFFRNSHHGKGQSGQGA